MDSDTHEFKAFQMDSQDDPAQDRSKRPKAPDPSEDQIANLCKKIQSGWDPKTRLNRAVRSNSSKIETEVIRMRELPGYS